MKSAEIKSFDLREVAERRLGESLAISIYARLRCCAACPPESYALIIVSANDYRCLSSFSCDGGTHEWMCTRNDETDMPPTIAGVLA